MPARCVDRRLQCGYSVAPTLLTTHKTLLQWTGDMTGRSHVADCVRCDRAIRQGALHAPPKLSLAIPSHKNPSIVIGFQAPGDHLSP
jgi:hypothetical protein